jgi:hypothetical protein
MNREFFRKKNISSVVGSQTLILRNSEYIFAVTERLGGRDAARRRPYSHRSSLIGVPSSTFVKKQENGISAFPSKRENNIHICIPIRYKTQKSQLKTNEKKT